MSEGSGAAGADQTPAPSTTPKTEPNDSTLTMKFQDDGSRYDDLKARLDASEAKQLKAEKDKDILERSVSLEKLMKFSPKLADLHKDDSAQDMEKALKTATAVRNEFPDFVDPNPPKKVKDANNRVFNHVTLKHEYPTEA
ncbi:MAG: hypothetical protein V3V41_07885 [Candidatus Heimdallarchaeota archaeon]